MNNEWYVLLKYAGPNLPTANGARASRQTNIMAFVTAKWDLQFSGDCHASFCLAMEKGTGCTRLLLTSSFRSRLFIIFLYVSSWLWLLSFSLPICYLPLLLGFLALLQALRPSGFSVSVTLAGGELTRIDNQFQYESRLLFAATESIAKLKIASPRFAVLWFEEEEEAHMVRRIVSCLLE